MRKQINFHIPLEWKEEIERQAREISYKEDRTVTYADLVRETLEKHLKLTKYIKHSRKKKKH
jgi:hypothetical protein